VIDMSIKGGLSVSVKGNTYQNIVTNGNFANGTTGWTSNNGTASIASSNVLSLTGNGNTAQPNIVQNLPIVQPQNKKIFARAIVRVTDSVCQNIRIRIFDNNVSSDETLNTPTANTWYVISKVFTMSAGAVGIPQLRLFPTYVDAITANGKVMEIKEIFTIDLTARGLDALTVDQCNARFQNWFDGVKSTLSIGNTLRTV
jgi:hypothetical protein